MSEEGVLALEMKKFVLQALLEKAGAVLPTRDVKAVLKNFQMEAEPGRMKLAATDLELSVIASTEMVKVETPGKALFPGRRLLDLVKEAEGGDLLLDASKGSASISVGRTTWDLKLMDGSEYPPLPEVTDVKFQTVNRSKFLAALGSTRYAAAVETVRMSLMMLDISGGKIRAADGTRFQQVDLNEWWPKGFDIQIPINAVEDLVGLLSQTEVETLQIGESENHLVFVLGSDTFIANKLVAEFPEVDDLLLKPALANDQKLVVDRSELIGAIRRVRVTADPETAAIVLDLDANTATVRSNDKFGNAATEALDASWESPARSVAFNGDHLLDMLRMTNLKSCEFYLGKDMKQRKSPMLLGEKGSLTVGILNQIRIDFLT